MPSDPTPNGLAARFASDPRGAGDEVFLRYARRLIGLARKRLDGQVLQKVDAEDVLQSVMRSFYARAVDGRLVLDDPEDLWALLAKMTRRKCNRKIRGFHAQSRDLTRETHATAHSGDDSEGDLDIPGDDPTPLEVATLNETLAILYGQVEAARAADPRAEAPGLHGRADRQGAWLQRAQGVPGAGACQRRTQGHANERTAGVLIEREIRRAVADPAGGGAKAMSANNVPSDPVSAETWRRRERIVEAFETAWQAGERPEIDDFLPEGADRRPVLIELIQSDIESRLAADLPRPVEDYLERYPDLAGDRNLVLKLIDTEIRHRRGSGRVRRRGLRSRLPSSPRRPPGAARRGRVSRRWPPGRTGVPRVWGCGAARPGLERRRARLQPVCCLVWTRPETTRALEARRPATPGKVSPDRGSRAGDVRDRPSRTRHRTRARSGLESTASWSARPPRRRRPEAGGAGPRPGCGIPESSRFTTRAPMATGITSPTSSSAG